MKKGLRFPEESVWTLLLASRIAADPLSTQAWICTVGESLGAGGESQ